ncbi:MAG: peptidoglycan-binding protein [Flavobacteriales bacterium]|nr:peptidoglycan-binding protein [Flavobacteriales bacterium]
MGGSDILFGLGSSFPRLGPDGRLASVLAAALQRGAKPADPKIPESVVCFGFASASGSPESNRKLSRRRAEAVKAILDRNHDAWHDLSRNHFGTHDIQAFLADLDTLEHLGCDPGPVDGVDGPRTRAAIEAFQRHANERWKLGLVEDGLCGPRTWGAVLRALVACVQTELGQDPSQEPVWKPMPWGRKGEGVYANGEDFASEQEDPDERSVQIAFFAQGSEPRMEDHKGPTKATRRQNPTQDPAQVRKQRIVQIGLAPSEAEATADPSATSAATTESPPASADTADDSPASTSVASSAALSDLKIKFLSESGYCGDTIQIQVDGEQDSINRAVKIQITSGNNSAALESIPTTLGTVPYKAKWIAKKPGPDWPGSEIKISAESGASSYAGDNHFHFKRIPDCREELKTIACSSGIIAWTEQYHIGFRSGILHITTRIKLINRLGAKPTGGGSPPPIGPPVTAAEKASMKTDIESKLTGKWFMHRVKCGRDKRCDCDEKNGCCKFRVRVHVEFVESGEDHVVDLFQGTGRASSRKWTRVKTRPNSWAHETGHLLGWYDEYADGALGATPRWKVTNPDAVMGSGLRVPFTYYWDFRDWLKAKTSQEWEGVD